MNPWGKAPVVEHPALGTHRRHPSWHETLADFHPVAQNHTGGNLEATGRNIHARGPALVLHPVFPLPLMKVSFLHR